MVQISEYPVFHHFSFIKHFVHQKIYEEMPNANDSNASTSLFAPYSKVFRILAV